MRNSSSPCPSTSSTSSVVTPEDVLESLMNDGTIDAIRLKIISQLKANHHNTNKRQVLDKDSIDSGARMEELKKNTITMVEQSKVLNTPGAEKQTKRELFDALRHELETPVLDKASKSVWELMSENEMFMKEIGETVERVFYRLSGQEPLPLALPNGKLEAQEQPEQENHDENGNTDSLLKKRSFHEISVEGSGAPGEFADGSGEPLSAPSVPEDSSISMPFSNVKP
ncbi:hypothetical protein C5167_015933 [Papaver somniferum]|nr:hypothetical protein C5167_015933 [Papaver somniferum]